MQGHSSFVSLYLVDILCYKGWVIMVHGTERYFKSHLAGTFLFAILTATIVHVAPKIILLHDNLLANCFDI